jgi:hypothetical protein
MKKILLLLALLATIYSCTKEEVILDDEKLSTLTISANLEGESELSFEDSYSKWIELKKENSDSYIYQTRHDPYGGNRSVTELRIKNGVIAERNYEEYMWDSNGQTQIIDSYSETNANLGSHKKGAGLLTIDDLYNSCSEYLSKDPNTNTLYYSTEINGLMTFCGYHPDGTVDGFPSVNIISFTWI